MKKNKVGQTEKIILSVLMPARNAERTIGLAVKSALFAMPENSELLVLLDDCSDRTAQVLQKIADPRLVVLDPGGKFGITKARNFLLSKAAGQFIAVLDADDIALPWRFKNQVKQLSEGLDFICGTALIFGKNLKPLPVLPQWPIPINSDLFPELLTIRNPVVHSSSSFTKMAAELAGGYPDLWPMEDYGLWLKFASLNLKMKRTPLPIVLYRFHSGQTTQTSKRTSDKGLTSKLEIQKRNLAHVLRLDDLESIRRKRLYGRRLLLKIEALGFFGINAKKTPK